MSRPIPHHFYFPSDQLEGTFLLHEDFLDFSFLSAGSESLSRISIVYVPQTVGEIIAETERVQLFKLSHPNQFAGEGFANRVCIQGRIPSVWRSAIKVFYHGLIRIPYKTETGYLKKTVNEITSQFSFTEV
jgi:hypothetical protein